MSLSARILVWLVLVDTELGLVVDGVGLAWNVVHVLSNYVLDRFDDHDCCRQLDDDYGDDDDVGFVVTRIDRVSSLSKRHVYTYLPSFSIIQQHPVINTIIDGTQIVEYFGEQVA